MTTQSLRPRRLRNLENWRLRWKVTAVLAIPLTVAMALGGLRAQDEISKTIRFADAAGQVATVPDIVALGTAFGTLSAGYVVEQIAPGDKEAVPAAVANVRAATAAAGLPAEIMDQLSRSLSSIEDLTGRMETHTAPADLSGQTTTIRSDLTRIIDQIVAPIDDRAVLAEHTRLVDAWSAQRRLAEQVDGVTTLIANPRAPLTRLVSASGSELAMIDTLARSYPLEDTKINTLRDGVQRRTDLIENAGTGALPLRELRTSMIASRDIYGSLISEASDAITATVDERAADTRTAAIRDVAIVLVTLLGALVLALLVSRSLVVPLRKLRNGSLRVARQDLPAAIDRIKDGDRVVVTDFEPVPVHTTEEIGQLARAVDDIHGQALRLAGEQAHLRLQVSDMFETLARRSKSLVDQQLGLIESLEFEEKDPARLDNLFRLDHLAARMRRNGDNLLILAGTRTRHAPTQPVPLGDVVRAAMSEVENYERVRIGSVPSSALTGSAAPDIVHLLAELLDNSLRASPPDSQVEITFARAVDGGVLLEVADRGIGIPTDDLTEFNERLASGGEVSADTTRHMGLFVVSRLASRHGLTVRLRRTLDTPRNHGVTASVHVPDALLVATEFPTRRDLEVVVVQQESQPAREPSRPIAPPPTVIVTAPNPSNPSNPSVLPKPAEHVLPQRVPASGLPQRTPGASGLGQRPGTTAPPAVTASEPDRGSATAEPASPDADERPGTVAPAAADTASSRPEPGEGRRHRYRADTAKTASFFDRRLKFTETDVDQATTPIFSDMVSDWLSDPTASDPADRGAWVSAADAGWSAANQAAETTVETRSEAGLPQRRPGHRLVPGGVAGVAGIASGAGGAGGTGSDGPRRRDPETIRQNLSRHQKGTRAGRAAGTAERNDNGGNR